MKTTYLIQVSHIPAEHGLMGYWTAETLLDQQEAGFAANEPEAAFHMLMQQVQRAEIRRQAARYRTGEILNTDLDQHDLAEEAGQHTPEFDAYAEQQA